MNYPVWESTFVGGASWIALITILHVYIAHLAVGGGFFIWLTDRKAWRESLPQWHVYVRRHTWFFLYLTMVFGGVSGVGIWFIIALVNPAGTSVLIHYFMFGWAMEWVFFVGEIVSLLLLAYRFEHLDRRARQILAFLYALFAWLSLLIINGILSFMLTPGRWVETLAFWDGFLNPTFLPSLCFRTAMALMIAGLFGFVTAVMVREEGFRTRLIRYCTRWLLWPMPVGILSAWWYVESIPPATRAVAFGQNQQIPLFVTVFLAASAGLVLLALALARRSGLGLQRAMTILVVLVGLGWIGGFEYVREIARKPYLITNFLYSNSIWAADPARLNEKGVLASARWSSVKAVDSSNVQEAGRELFNLQCLGCHTVGGIRNDVIKHTASLTYLGILAHLDGQGRLLRYMPPVFGTREEKEALATYVAGLGGKEIRSEPEPYPIKPLPTTMPPKTPSASGEADSYALLAWNHFGINGVSDCDPWFLLIPPGNTLEAQLIKCGLFPELVGEGVELTYRVEQGFENPAAHAPFWDHAEANLGRKLDRHTGRSGAGLSGKFTYDSKSKSYSATHIPVVPHPDGGGFNPYPLFTVEARDTNSGRVLATTAVVAPVSTELGCRHCHGGGWRTDGVAGISQETAENILRAHDRINKTTLLAEARAGKPRACQSCHADPLLDAAGKPGVMNLSAAMHGWHAHYMPAEGAQACALCHPTSRTGPTRCWRGFHSVMGLTCVKCHGALADHALALLENQKTLPAAQALMASLKPSAHDPTSPIAVRTPWLQEPDCLSCHKDFAQPKSGFASFNHWTPNASALYRNRVDDTGVRCAACHGSPHAEYPALNPYHPSRDNLQPLQYSNQPYPIGANKNCKVCHLEDMENPPHHPNMDRMFRNSSLWQKAWSKATAPSASP
jgi:mono/diheme cytochrome c family protein